jgi:chromosome segregation ATPase
MGKKEAYQEKMEAQLKQWEAEIAKLEAKADKAKAQAKIEYYEHLEELRSKRDNARQKLTSLKQASDAAWDDLKTGLDDVWKDLETAVDSAATRFKESTKA